MRGDCSVEADRMKWEYKTQLVGKVDLELDRITKYLNLQGNDGWELAAVDNGVAYFKRPIQEAKLGFLESSGLLVHD